MITIYYGNDKGYAFKIIYSNFLGNRLWWVAFRVITLSQVLLSV